MSEYFHDLMQTLEGDLRNSKVYVIRGARDGSG